MIYNLRTQKEFEEVYTEMGELRTNIPCKTLRVSPHYYGCEFYLDICAVMGARVFFTPFAEAQNVTSSFVDEVIARLKPTLGIGTYKFILTDTHHSVAQYSKKTARDIICGRAVGLGNFRVLPLDCLFGDRKGFHIQKLEWAKDESFFWLDATIEASTHDALKLAVKEIQLKGFPGAVVDVRGSRFLFPTLREEQWVISKMVESTRWSYAIGVLHLTNAKYPDCEAIVRRGISRIDATDMYHNQSQYLGSTVIIQHEGRSSKCPTKIKNPRLKALFVTAPVETSLIV